MDAHGHYNIELRDGYIYIQYIGEFNVEAAESVYRDFKSSLLELDDRNIKVIVDCLEFKGATPECFTVTKKINKLQNDRNLLGKAVISQSEFHKKVLTMQDNEFAKQNVKVFTSVLDGELWLNTL